MWNICHKSGRVVFTTVDEQTAMNRKKFGWMVDKVPITFDEALKHTRKKHKTTIEALGKL